MVERPNPNKPARDAKGRFIKEPEYVFSRIARNMPIGLEKDLSKEARDWFRDSALAVNKVNVDRLFEASSKQMVPTVNQTFIGKMLVYSYDPKHKKTLPYYDRFPCIFVIEMYKDGFLGINLHYLPPLARAKFMDSLYQTLSSKTLTNKSKLNINYQFLKGATKFKAFEPCIKRYLFGHVRTKFMFVEPQKWDIVLFLPIAKFAKQGQEQVWRDSMRKIHG